MRHISDSLYQTLLEINNILVREVTPEGLFRSLAKTLQPIVGCDRCSLTIYDPETDTLSWFARSEGIRVTRMDAEHHAPLRGPLARRAIANRTPVIIPCLEAYADDEAIKLMIDAGLQSSMAFPLLSRNKPIGVLSISFARPLDEHDEQLSCSLEKISAQVALAVENMLIHAKLNQKNEDLHRQVGTLLNEDGVQHAGSRFFYNCAAMSTLMGQIRLLAKSDASVLICGETGTGKEFVARFIHRYSPRKAFNFVKVNCPALSPTLFESELFGHAKGAFTGASNGRIGRFELADNGSIFLDEIGDLDIILQAKLLHVLQDAKLERVGENRSISINTRCISATNADLHHMMREGRFRRDLFYRLGVTTVQVPPLRDREGELSPMLQHIMCIHASDMKCAPATFHPEALHMLEDYHWPGNVRELSNLLARLLILHPGLEIGPDEVRPLLEQSSCQNSAEGIAPQGAYMSVASLQPHHQSAPPLSAASGEKSTYHMPKEAEERTSHALAQAEKLHIERVLAITNGRVSGTQGAAVLLSIPRSTLQYKLKKHGINPKDHKRRL